MIYWVLLIIIAILGYGAGSISGELIASKYVFRTDLARLGKGNVGLSNFRRVYGLKGFLLLLAVEVVHYLPVILIGGWLMGIKEQALIGRLFAGFCLIMGRQWPVFYNLRGSHGTICLLVTAFCAQTSVGVVALLTVAVLLITTRYVALATVAAGFMTVIFCLLVQDNTLAVLLALCIAGVVLVRHIPSIARILRGAEPRLSLREDISYKFDQKF